MLGYLILNHTVYYYSSLFVFISETLEEALPQVSAPETSQPSSGASVPDAGKKIAPNRSKFASIHDYKEPDNNDEDEGQRCLINN